MKTNPWIQVTLAALIMGSLSYLFTAYAWLEWSTYLGEPLSLAAFVAGFLTTFLLWYFAHGRLQNFTAKRSLCCGAGIGLLIHPMTWYMRILSMNLGHYVLRDGSCPIPPVDPMHGLITAIDQSYLSLALLAYITIPLLALANFGMCRFLEYLKPLQKLSVIPK